MPPGAPRTLRVASPNEVTLWVGGEELAPEQPLPPGEHALTVFWRGDLDRDVSLALEWSTGGEAFEEVPFFALRPAADHLDWDRVTLWGVGGGLMLLFGCLAFAIAFARTARARRRRLLLAVTLALCALGLGYRAMDYDVMPETFENPDELFAEWNGFGLLTDGTTQGWSLWPEAYGDLVEVEHFSYFRERPVRIIRPYFEHPPLLHVMVGAAAKLGGATHWAHARLRHTRWVPILLGTLCVWLIVAIGRRLDPRGPAPYLAALLYATLPMIALQGRVIKEEALVAPMALGAVLFYLRYRDDGERLRDLLGAAILAGGATLAKMPGAAFLPVVVFLLMLRRRYRAAFLAGLIGAAVASLVLVYGAVMDWEAFRFTTAYQAGSRPAHFNLYPRFFDDPLINHNLIGRGYLLFLWLAWAMSLHGRRGQPSRRGRLEASLAVPPIVYMLGIGLSSGNWTFGWYLMPIYPFLCLGAGRALASLWKEPTLVGGALFVALPVLYSMNFTVDPNWAMGPAAWPVLRAWVTTLLVAMLAPYALSRALPSPLFTKLARLSTAVGLAIIVVVSGVFVLRYDVNYELYQNFDRVTHFDR